ncbi:Mevalonate kinase [Kickxella alabastrina]|uniref:Mevalonate kinase n=1 Tax=Kickxella alabastrina TaxID=61397 RepID=A0ACC1I7G1_9FUNG|nr:Mevalonate kinase [Kickxella alabastrina]
MLAAPSNPIPQWPPFVASAPGKAILFGEHAVVYGKAAVAGSLSMRAYALVTPRTDGLMRLCLPDIDIDTTLGALPSAAAIASLAHPGDVATLLSAALLPQEGPGRTAMLTFAYLAGALLPASVRQSGLTLCVRSLVPVGAGLGSSAAFSVSLAAALLRLGGRVSAADSAEERQLVDQWAFRGEQVAHGTPSGIDNAVATHGGFLAYTRGSSPRQLGAAHPTRVVICDTRVPKSTRALVAGVRALRDQHPAAIDSIMDAIGALAEDAAQRFADPSAERLEDHLRGAVALNHALLAALGVSHPALERMRVISAAHKMPAKLTGAGGGGCALALVPQAGAASEVAAVCAELAAEGFACYPTVVGGAGIECAARVGAESVAAWVERVAGGGCEDLADAFAALSADALAELAPPVLRKLIH